MDLVNFVKLLLKRKVMIIAIPLFAIILSYFLLKHTPDVYKSKAKVATGITDEFTTSIEDTDSRKPHVIANKFSNLIQLIKSRAVVDLLSYKLIIHDLSSDEPFRENGEQISSLSGEEYEIIFNKFETKYDSLEMLTSMNPYEKKMGKLLEEKRYEYKNILEKLRVYRLEISDFIEIEYESENPNLSSFVVNQLITEFIKYYKSISNEKSNNSVSFFGDLAIQKKNELDNKVEIMKNYKLKNGIINLYEQTEAIVDQIAKVEIMREKDKKLITSLSEAIKAIDQKLKGRDQLFLEADMRPHNKEISKLKAEINSINNEIIRGLVNKDEIADSLNQLKNELNKKAITLVDELVVDPNVSMQTLIHKKLDYSLQLEIAKNSVTSIDQELERLYKVAASFAPSEALISSYEREISVAEEVYILMLNKLNSATLNSLNLAGSINQIESGMPAEKPEASKKLLLMILAGIVSFVFTVVIIFILEYLDLTIKTPVEFKMLANLPLVGILNRLKTDKLDLSNIFSENEQSSELRIFKQLLRSIRHEIDINLPQKGTLLVSSTKNQTGKSLIASSLAYSLGLTKKKVLLIDTNCANNSLSRQFDAKHTLQKYLLNETSLEESITKTSVPNVDVLGCELSTASLIEINGKDQIKKLFSEASALYDFIIVDGTAINKSVESKVLIEHVDKLLTIFSSTSVISGADKNTIAYLKSINEKHIGSILNNVADEHLETIIGEVPRHRNKVRVTIKKYLNRNFGKTVKNKETSIKV